MASPKLSIDGGGKSPRRLSAVSCPAPRRCSVQRCLRDSVRPLLVDSNLLDHIRFLLPVLRKTFGKDEVGLAVLFRLLFRLLLLLALLRRTASSQHRLQLSCCCFRLGPRQRNLCLGQPPRKLRLRELRRRPDVVPLGRSRRWM